ncbi:integrase, catalytic region, zinc finger, CCHC-type containing protein [Tanacetum coccineum]
MLERGSYIPWASRFRRYINRKRENRKWLNKALDEGPYQFEIFVPSDSTVPKLQIAEDLQGDALLHYDVEMELMNLILLSILNEIYNSVDACTTAKEIWKRVERLMRGTIQNQVDRETRFMNEFDEFVAKPGEHFLQPERLKYVTQVCLAKRFIVDSFDDLFNYLQQFEKLVNASWAKKLENSHDPLALVAHTGSSSRNTSSYYVIHPTSVVDYDDEYHGKGHYAKNCPKLRVRDSKYFMEQMLLAKQDEVGVILTDEHNDFLFDDASRMDEIEELSANICLMVIIQPTNNTSDAGPSYDSAFINLEAKLKKNVDLMLKLGNSLQGMFMLGPKPLSVYDPQLKHGLGYSNPYTLKQAISQCPKLYLASSLSNSEIPLNVRDTEDTLDDASKSQQKMKEKMNDPIAVANKQNCWTIDYQQINALYKDFVPQKELSAEQKYFPSSFIPFDKTSNATCSIPTLMPSESPLIIQLDKMKNCFQTLSELIQKNCKRASIFYTSPEEIQLNDFCQDQVKPIVNELQFYFEFFRKLFQRDIKEMKEVFESTESELCEIKKQNDFLKDQLVEASLKHEVEISVLINHECEDNSLHAELEQVKKNSIEIQEGLQAKIKILEKDVQRCQKQSVDFELKLQHEKEKHKWESTLNNKNTNPLDYSWISKMEKLENENVSLDFKVQSLMKERDNVKIEYQKLFDSIKKTRSQSQKEMDELIAHVSEKTYAYGAIRAENQNLLSTISELKTRLETVEKESQTNEAKSDLSSTRMNAASSVRIPMNRDSHVKNIVLVNSKNSAKKVAVYVRKNKQTDNTSANVISNKENVNDVNVANAAKAKTLLYVSCMQNVLIPCHAKCLSKYKLNVHSNDRRALSTNSRTPTSSNNTYIVLKTRFSEKLTQSKVVQIVLWIVYNGCSKHMTGDRSLLTNFIEKFMGTVRFGNYNFAAITGYGDYIQGNITICHVYYVEGLGHNLFSVGQFCDDDLEVAFLSKTCYVQNLEGDDLLTGGRESNLYIISISDMAASSPVCLMSKATSTKPWLWHRRLSHLNFRTINDLTRLDLVDGLPKFKYGKDHLCYACKRGKRSYDPVPIFDPDLAKTKTILGKISILKTLVLSDHSKLELLHMDLCGPMRVASINGNKYILVIVDDFSRYAWVYFLHSKDEAPEIIKKFIAQAQLNYKAKVCKIRTDNGTEFKNATLKAHYEKLGIMQQFLTARTPQQNGVVERRNRTLVEAARTMLIFSQLPEFVWAEAVATTCFTQN